MFFRHAVSILRQSGHEVLCTSRKYREAIELAKLRQLDLTIIGSHGGSDRYDKLRQSAIRTLELSETIRHFGPDIALTFSSPEGSRVAFGLGIKHLGFNDSPHAQAVAKLTIPLMNKLLCPWVIPYTSWTSYGIARQNIWRYRALDPVAWLKHPEEENEQQYHLDSNRAVLLRLEESKASYIADNKLGTVRMVDDFVNELSHSNSIIVLCRYADQIAEVEARYGKKVHVLKDVVDGTSFVRSVQLFIGAGGTMTAEAALLGKPTISIAPIQYHVEKYLLRTGLVKKAADSKTLIKLAKKLISDQTYQHAQKKKADRILAQMEDPTDKMIAAIMP